MGASIKDIIRDSLEPRGLSGGDVFLIIKAAEILIKEDDMTIAPKLSDFTKSEIKEVLNEIRHPFSMAVWGIENAFNLGAIIRTSNAFLADKIYAVDTDGYYPKACMGMDKYENIIAISIMDFVLMAKDRNVVGCEKRPDIKSESLYSFKHPEHPIFLFGSEKTGIPNELLEVCKFVVTIPMYGLINDLNVALASGIVMYDWLNKNYNKGR